MGFDLVRLPSWERFVATGELARTLTRACVLDGRLGYDLIDTDGALELRVTFAGVTHAIAIPIRGEPLDRVDDILAAINAITPPPHFVRAGLRVEVAGRAWEAIEVGRAAEDG